jgi:DNA-binding HxlR family transcriptional regulator
VDPFRYEQFCPLARATEILGHRWVMLILRELFAGPQRFSDLRRRLPGLSSSMLADRLTGLEGQGVVARRELEPPAAATVYELTDDGRALEPAMLALTRWGARFLISAEPGDHVEPDWLGMAVEAFSRSATTPARRFELRPYRDDREAVIRVSGGPDGTHRVRDDLPVDACIRAPVMIVMGLMSGAIPSDVALTLDGVQVEGDPATLSDLPELFERFEMDL